MIKCLNKSTAAWNPSTHFNGPLALLALVVVNDINERAKRKSEHYTVEWVCKTHLKNIENYMKPGSKTKLEKKQKGMKNKTKKTKASTKLEENHESNTKQLVVLEEDDGYDTEEEEYLAICNEYKENEENDFMISESGNHLILPVVSQVWINHCTPPEDDDKHIKEQFDAHEETKNVVDKIEEDNVSSEATKIDHEEEHNLYENLIHEESSPEALNLQMVIVKDKNHVVDKNEDCEFDTEEIKTLKDEVEASKLRETTLEKENTYIKSERDMAMQRNEDLENMLKQLKLERELVKDIKNLCNDELETKSVKKDDEKHIEEWNFIYKINRFCMKRRNGSIFYLNSIKEVLDLPIGDLKQMIHSKEDGKDISSKERHTILCMNKFIFNDEKMHPHYDQTPNNDTLGKCEGNKEAEPMHNQTEEDSGEVDINKLIKENNILDAESEKTLVGSRIGVSNVQSPLNL
ncbi:hypothetical protein L1987_60614 [Smallanthus sonchifolius]|uniref:Uncharacterized protein n=1 Tax=Smallanthus sonchifolius TaxID=185202 RepID=A0ACB9D8S0_9ASTR|nr:hypothetical protein L1987_60614 [Smallanthus sonchifolius]